MPTSEMTSTRCSECGHQMGVPNPYIGRQVKCGSCLCMFTAQPILSSEEARQLRDEQRRQKAEEAKLLRLTEVRDFLAAYDQHYLDMDSESRHALEDTVARLFETGPYSWSELEASIVKLASQIDGRTEFLNHLHQQRLECLLLEVLQATARLRDAIPPNVTGLNNNLNSIRAATTVSGLASAHALGEMLSDD